MRRLRWALAASALLAGVLLLSACAPATPGLPGTRPPVASPTGAPAASDATPDTPSRAVSGAFAVGSGTDLTIELWVDYFCPFCGMFEAANGDFLDGLVESGAATLRIHPISILDRASMGTKYSTRAANAAACVAELAPEDYWGFHRELFAQQPEEGTEGLDDEALVALAPSSGEVADCIGGHWFSGWVTDETQAAIADGVQGTPTVFVNGDRFRGAPNDGVAFRALVESAAGKR